MESNNIAMNFDQNNFMLVAVPPAALRCLSNGHFLLVSRLSDDGEVKAGQIF